MPEDAGDGSAKGLNFLYCEGMEDGVEDDSSGRDEVGLELELGFDEEDDVSVFSKQG